MIDGRRLLFISGLLLCLQLSTTSVTRHTLKCHSDREMTRQAVAQDLDRLIVCDPDAARDALSSSQTHCIDILDGEYDEVTPLQPTDDQPERLEDDCQNAQKTVNRVATGGDNMAQLLHIESAQSTCSLELTNSELHVDSMDVQDSLEAATWITLKSCKQRELGTRNVLQKTVY
ncbi:hypothetical protein FGB62_6g417 [Gracilaria domingensis]|nr:hypothetical protein FGB62_6g417 [Gracilaria domingensis]